MFGRLKTQILRLEVGFKYNLHVFSGFWSQLYGKHKLWIIFVVVSTNCANDPLHNGRNLGLRCKAVTAVCNQAVYV